MTKLAGVLDASENRKGSVRSGTLTATRNSQQRNRDKSKSGVLGFAQKQDLAVRRPFAVFDIDGTLIRWQLYHAIADTLVHLGYIDRKAFQAVKDARMQWKRRTHTDSFKDYEHTLVKLVDSALAQLTIRQYKKAVGSVFDEYKDQAYTYTRDLLKELKAKNYLLFAISGSQEEIVEKIAGHYGFDDFVGSTLVQKNGKFTGEKIVRAGNKHEILEQLIKKHKTSLGGSIAVGDSLGDSSMLEMVDYPIAFNPEKKLFELAKSEGWKIVAERKNVVFELESKNGKYLLA